MALKWVIIGFLTGILLGLRYKVLILLPAFALAAIIALTIGFARGDSFGSIILAMMVLWIAIEISYLVGIAIRATVRRRKKF
jgi:hypothetical protein